MNTDIVRAAQQRFLAEARAQIAADKDVQFAISLDGLQHAADADETGVNLVLEYIGAVDTSQLTDGLREDVRLLRKAREVLRDRELVFGMTYHNLRINFMDSGARLHAESTPGPAREAVARIVASVPDLAQQIADQDPVVPY